MIPHIPSPLSASADVHQREAPQGRPDATAARQCPVPDASVPAPSAEQGLAHRINTPLSSTRKPPATKT